MSSEPDAALKHSPPGNINSWRQRLRRRFRAWVNRRIPAARSVTLDQKRIFIMPSRVGLFFLVCLLVMLLTAINYQNNMSYALTFLLSTLFVIGILHTYANLAGLSIHAIKAAPAYPGQLTGFDLRLDCSSKRPRYALRLHWPNSSERVVNLIAADSENVRLHCPVGQRGWHHPGRLRVESTYPLGLLRCWTWVDLDLRALVYPQPLASSELPGQSLAEHEGNALPAQGSDDFYGFRDYRAGDSLRQVHWKGYAKGQSLQSKQYGAYADRSVWLDWDGFAGLPTERRLSHLCYWALEFYRQQDEYGLRLPGLVIAPGSGEKQLATVLTALALYGIGKRSGRCGNTTEVAG